MKTITLTLLCSLILFSATAQETKTYYDNGQLKEVGSFDKKGEKTGEWKKYYEEGKLEEVTSYKNGEKNSFEKHRKNGLLTASFKPTSKGKYIYKTFDLGVLLSETDFNSSKKRDGKMRLYYNTGELRAIMNYHNDLLEGACSFFFKSGNPRETGKYEKNLKEGVWKKYFENKKIKSVCSYKKDIEEGEYKEYAENGQLKIVGNYNNGKETGQWKYYSDDRVRVETKDQNGYISKIAYYENNKLVKTLINLINFK